MQGRKRVLMTLAMSCLVSYSAIAAGSPPDENNQTPCFAISGCNQNASALMANLPSQATLQQAPGSMPKAAASHPPAMKPYEKIHYYLKSTYGPSSLAFSMANAGINQARDTVPEWGQGMQGYSKRFASSFGQKAIERTIDLGLKTTFHEDLRYFRLGQNGIWQRSFYAFGQVYIAHKDSRGTRPNYTWFASAFGASYISRHWHPDSYHNWGERLSDFAASIGLKIAQNFLDEFWPDFKRMLHH
jgi:hypothetical protein